MELDWSGVVSQVAREGRLMEFLESLPRARWSAREQDGWTLLHYACRGDNVAAAKALLAHGMGVNTTTMAGWTPAHHASWAGQTLVLKVLVQAGADLMARTPMNVLPLDLAMQALPGATSTVQYLLAMGVRLKAIDPQYVDRVTPELLTFERGVLRCRSATVALLRVKQRSHGTLACWDRYLLAFLARLVWTTRGLSGWQEK